MKTKKTRQPVVLLPPGTIVARFAVLGEPVPWSPPDFGRGSGRTPKQVKAWKDAVAMAAHGAGLGQLATGNKPYGGPVGVSLWFYRATRTKSHQGRPWATRPDIDNLVKATIDAVCGNACRPRTKARKGQPVVRACNLPPGPVGRILVDDNQVTHVVASKWLGARSGVAVQVVALGPRQAIGNDVLMLFYLNPIRNGLLDVKQECDRNDSARTVE